MVDFQNPAVIEKDFCAYTSDLPLGRGQSIEPIFGSGASKVMACPGWALHVSPRGPPQRTLSLAVLHNSIFLVSSWEFVVTLDFEWGVFRGHRPYRWAIWVCATHPFGHVSRGPMTSC